MKRRIRLHRDRSYRGIKLLQASTGSYKTSGRSQASDEMCEPSLSLIPDLRSGTFVVGAPISRVVVLVRIEILIRTTCRQLTCDDLRTVGRLEWMCFDQLHAEAAKNSFSLGAGVLW